MIKPARMPTVQIDRATIGGAIYVPPICAAQAITAASLLSRPNPAYKRWVRQSKRMGRPAGEAPDEVYTTAGRMFGEPYDGWWWLPRHAPVHIVAPTEATVLPAAAPVELSIALRPYQAAAVDALLFEQSGVIVAPCGAGKTTIGASLIARVNTPALVLVHTLDLAEQWRERCRSQLGVEAGLIGNGARELEHDGATRRVVVATIQTLAAMRFAEVLELGARFGMVVLDEAHHAPARTFSQVLSALPGRYRVGLTATPGRADGLEDFLFWSCGRVVAQIDQGQLQAAGFTMSPIITWVPTSFVPRTTAEDWTGLCNELAADEDRNALIIAEVVRRARAGRRVLLLADRVAHCTGLAEVMGALGVAAAALTGRLTKRARADVLARFGAGALAVVTATSLADEGLDVAGIDCVVLATPSRNEGRVQQRVGRALRPLPGKTQPEVLDFVDPFGAARGAASKRRTLYRKLGWNPPPVPRVGVSSG